MSTTTTKSSHSLVLKQPPLFDLLPTELHVHILTYLRAYDLSAVQQSCRYFACRPLISSVIQHTAEHVYPPSLTNNFHLEGKEYTFESLRNMELLVVARVLSQPEPTSGFYVSKSWCRQTLKWLEIQQEESLKKSAASSGNGSSGKRKKKMSKKEQRLRNRRLSDASPPWPNVNSDLVCCHDNLGCVKSSKAKRAKRRLMDKQAWRVLKKLYPDSVTLDSKSGECLQCLMEIETSKREQHQIEESKKEERRKPLGCPIVRGIYTRSRGVPPDALKVLEERRVCVCPLKPGLYGVLPRGWLHGWRKYLKNGEGEAPCPPDSSELLCHAHRFPLLPPHLEAFLQGETRELFSSVTTTPTTNNGWISAVTTAAPAPPPPPAAAAGGGGVARRGGTLGTALSPVVGVVSRSGPVVGYSPVSDPEVIATLRAAGVSQAELDAQNDHFRRLLVSRPQGVRGPVDRLRWVPQQQNCGNMTTNELLDLENNLVVEILTDEEMTALDRWWPDSVSFSLRFGVDMDGNISWSTAPCRGCDPTGRESKISIKKRNRSRNHNSNTRVGTDGLE